MRSFTDVPRRVGGLFCVCDDERVWNVSASRYLVNGAPNFFTRCSETTRRERYTQSSGQTKGGCDSGDDVGDTEVAELEGARLLSFLPLVMSSSRGERKQAARV